MAKTQVKYFSGYIRNFKKLCAELDIAADLSREKREEEIVIKAYEKWGVKLTDHIFGAFAIGVYDAESDKLYVIRDQVGQKQMFYAVIGGELVYSGDIDEIVKTEGFEKRLNKTMLQQYLFYGYPIGEETFYEDVFKLMPGCYIEWDG